MTHQIPPAARRVLVTGGNGFIGSWVVKNLLDRGCSPVVFDVGVPGPFIAELLGDRLVDVEWVTGDIRSFDEVLGAMHGADAAIHLAGVLMPFCSDHPVEGAQINVLGHTNVLTAAQRLGLPGVAYASSAAVYSASGIETAPGSLYGAYKLSGEFIAQAFYAEFGLRSMGLRPLVVYGPGREVGASAGISLACRAAVRGEAYEIPLGGATDAVFVADVADAFAVSALEPLDGALSCSLVGELTSFEEIADTVSQLVPGARIGVGTGTLGIHPDLSAQDLRRLRDDFTRTDLRSGLQQTLDAYR